MGYRIGVLRRGLGGEMSAEYSSDPYLRLWLPGRALNPKP